MAINDFQKKPEIGRAYKIIKRHTDNSDSRKIYHALNLEKGKKLFYITCHISSGKNAIRMGWTPEYQNDLEFVLIATDAYTY